MEDYVLLAVTVLLALILPVCFLLLRRRRWRREIPVVYCRVDKSYR
jgi:hypothetical protein